MKIVAVFKWSKNPQDARVGTDGSVDWRGVKMSATDDDPTVMSIARELASDTDEIIGLTIGDGDLAWAAARGASSTVVVSDELEKEDSVQTGKILAAAVQHIGDADVVLIGDSSWDYGVVAALMGELERPAFAGVVSVAASNGKLQITRKNNGLIQRIDMTSPAVLAVAASRAEDQAPGMKEVLVARKKPVHKLTLADLGIQPSSALRMKGTKLPDTAPAKIIDGADPTKAAQELLAALRMEGVL